MAKDEKKPIRCAIYTRKSTQEGLEQEFNSLDAQREAGEAYVKSQKHELWTLIPKHYDDGGFSGGSLERPALHELMADIKKGLVDVVVVYKVDRLSRSLHDFAKLVEIFEKHKVSFVSVTQQFNTTSSMGRLTLNILLSFAQFEREVTGERIRDKIAASRQKGMWMGGTPPLGYGIKDKKLFIIPEEAETIRFIFQEYLAAPLTVDLIKALKEKGIKSKTWVYMGSGELKEGKPFNKGMLYHLLHNRIYIGEAVHKDKSYPGEHQAIISRELFDKVQAKLSDQNPKAEYNQHQSQGLLKGLLFDEYGRAYSPTYSVRKGKKPGENRYNRYYVSQRVIQEGYDVPGIKNIRMDDLDRLILDHMQKSLPPHTFRGWDKKHLRDKRELLQQYVDKVVIHEDKVVLLLKVEEGIENHSIPMRFRKYGGKKLMLDSAGKDILPMQANKDGSLIAALVRAHRWDALLASGKNNSLRSIAKAEDMEHRYVAEIYRLNFLSPRIKEAIIDGMQPRTLTLSRLMHGIPLSWQEQARTYGF